MPEYLIFNSFRVPDMEGRKAEPWTGSAEWELWMNVANLGRCVHFSADHISVSALQ